MADFFIGLSDAPKHDITWTENGNVIDRFLPEILTLKECSKRVQHKFGEGSTLLITSLFSVQIMSYLGASDRPINKVGQLPTYKTLAFDPDESLFISKILKWCKIQVVKRLLHCFIIHLD